MAAAAAATAKKRRKLSSEAESERSVQSTPSVAYTAKTSSAKTPDDKKKEVDAKKTGAKPQRRNSTDSEKDKSKPLPGMGGPLLS